jgi:hypothetical protein
MPDIQEYPLRQLAAFAAYNAIKGSSFKRNSLLKPLDIILQELDRSPHSDDEQELEFLRAGTKELIFEHLARIAKEEYAPGRTKRSKVDHYVDLFFDGVLTQTYHRKVNALLTRDKLLRAAYLFWVRQAWAEIFVARGEAKNLAQATDELQQLDEEAPEEVTDGVTTEVGEEDEIRL